MTKHKEKSQSRELRKRGRSIGEIARQLHVSKSSVSLWCNDIELAEEQKQKIRKYVTKAGQKGRDVAVKRNRLRKKKRIDYWNREGVKEFDKLSKRELLLSGSVLYWAEGSKTRPRFSFSNSDPKMIKFLLLWLEKGLDVKKEDLVIRVQINHIHKPRIKKVLNFWSQLLKLPPEQFKKTFYVKTKNKKMYENHDNYYGILVVRVRKSSELVYKVLGQINALKKLSG